MDELRTAGDDVTVLTSDHRFVDRPGDDPPQIDRTLRLYHRDGDLWSPGLRDRLAVERHNRRRVIDALERVQPDVVSVWHVGALSLGVLDVLVERRVPTVFAVSDDWTTYAHRLDPWTRATLHRPRLGAFTARVAGVSHGLPAIGDLGPFCFISEVTRQRALAKSPWRFATTGLVFSGIDGALFPVDTAPPAPRPIQGPLNLLYVGRVDERKGIHTLIRALARLDDAVLTIDGRSTDADAKRVQTWADDAGVSARVTMACSDREDLPARYRAADICVFPSEWNEPFGLVPIEAMACDTPVVASGDGGSAEFLVDGVNAALFAKGDPDALAAAVERVAHDATVRHRLVTNGRDLARYFDVAHLAEAFADWHEYAITGDRRPADRRPPRPR